MSVEVDGQNSSCSTVLKKHKGSLANPNLLFLGRVVVAPGSPALNCQGSSFYGTLLWGGISWS